MTDEELDAELMKARRISELKASLSQEPSLGERALSGVGSIAKAGKTVWDNLARGAGNAVAGATSQTLERDAPELFPKKSPLGQFSENVALDVQEKLPIPKDETTLGKLTRKGTEAVGGGLVMGLPGIVKSPIAALTSLFTGGIGADLGATTGRNLGGGEGKLADVLEGFGGLAGGFAGALPTGMLLGPKQSVAEADVRRAMKSTQEGSGGAFNSSWDARTNLGKFDVTGAKTATLADAFPKDSAIVALAEKARNSTLENALRTATQGREGDIAGLVDRAMTSLGPRSGSPLDVVKAIKEAASNRLTSARARSNKPYAELEKLASIPDEVMLRQIRQLETSSQRKGLANPDRVALTEIIEALTDANNPTTRLILDPKTKHLDPKIVPGAQTRPEALSLNIADFGDKQANRLAGSPQQLSPVSSARAQGEASALVADLPAPWGPEYSKARIRATDRREKLYNPLLEGPVGKVAGMNPNSSMEPVLAALENTLKGRDAGEVTQLLKQLEKGQQGSTQGVARALLENRGSNMPPEQLPGGIRPREGTPAGESLNTLIDRTGGNSGDFNRNLDVAKTLTERGLSGGVKEPPTIGWQQLIRPFRTIDMAFTGKTERAVQNEIAKLLSDRNGLAKLEELAKFDPNVRRLLIAQGVIAPQFTKD